MNIPTHIKKVNFDIYKTNDIKLIEFLKKNEILPVNLFDNIATFINTKELFKFLKQYESEVKDG